MAHLQLAPQSFTKRKSLRDRIAHIDTLDDDAAMELRFNFMEENNKDLEESEDFRWAAPKTQSMQDHHLEMYRNFVLKWVEGFHADELEAISEEEQLLLMFPEDEGALGGLLKSFMMFVFKRATPRAHAADTIQTLSLVKWRISMLFWTRWYYGKRDKQWSRAKIFNQMTVGIRYVQKKYGGRTSRSPKAWLGLPELRQLLDFEAMTNRCVELSEEHQALWCIGRVTALRPGSLCPSGKYSRNKPLTWRDFSFTRGDEPGRFDVRLTVDRLDLKHPGDATTAEKLAPPEPVTLRLSSPHAGNIMFSAPHRLLVIALRRGILRDVSGLDELLDHSAYVISIAPEHLDDVVFLGSGPKGDAVNPEKPLTAYALTNYLQRRGKQIGYTMPITWYSLRRRAATDMVARIGVDATRLFMGHSPDSQTLERYYLKWTEILDVSGAMLDQPISATGYSEQQRQNWAPLAMDKLDNNAIKRLRGSVLSQITRRLILADPDPPQHLSPQELKNYRRDARRAAEQQLAAVEAENLRTTISKAEMDQRRAGLKASQFADEVLRRALKATGTSGIGRSSTGQTDSSLENDQDEDGYLFIRDEDETALEPEPERDFEETIASFDKELNRDDSGAIIASVDAEDYDIDPTDALSTQTQDASYQTLAKTMMELLLDNSLSEHSTWTGKSKEQKVCPVCQDDDTVSKEQQAKPYKLKAHLDSHMNGNFHHPVTKWKRKAETEYRLENGHFECPYCKESGMPHPRTHKRMGYFIAHIMQSTAASTNRLHDELKAANGWYDEDFELADKLPASAESQAKHMWEGARSLVAAGIETIPRRLLLRPEPYEKSESIVRGSHPDGSLPARYQPFVQSGQPSMTEDAENAVPSHLKELVGVGDYMRVPEPLPTYMRDVVNVSRYLRSQEEAGEDQDMTG